MAMYTHSHSSVCLYTHIPHIYVVSSKLNLQKSHAGLSIDDHDNIKRLWMPLRYNNDEIEQSDTDTHIEKDNDIDTKKPTKNPTPSPTQHTISFVATTEIDTEEAKIKPTCQSIQSAKFDVIVLYDNSCGLNNIDCDDLLAGVGSIISLLLNPSTRVQTMQIESNGNAKTIVSFDDDDLQRDKSQYIRAIHHKGHCDGITDGNIDLVQALNDTMSIFDYDIVDKHNKIIIVSACYDERVCDDDYPESIIALQLKYKNIQIYPINLIKSSSTANNVITSEVADIYLKCCNQRVCFGENTTDIVDDCLYPRVCEVPLKYDQMSGNVEGQLINPFHLNAFPEQHSFPQYNIIDSISSESFDSISSDSSDSNSGKSPMPTPQPTKKPTPKPTFSPTVPTRPAPLPHPNTGSPSFKQAHSYTHPSPTLPTAKVDVNTPSPLPTMSEDKDVNNLAPNEQTEKTYTYLRPKPYVPDVRCHIGMDFIVLFDDSCGFSYDDCGVLLEGVSDIVSTLLSMGARVQTMQFKADIAPDIIVGFDDEEMQKNMDKYLDTVRTFGECRDGGNGYTDLNQALNDAILYFDSTDYRSHKIITVNGCMDYKDEQLCTKTVEKLKNHDVEIYAVNLIKSSNAENVIQSRQQAKEYLLCLTDFDEDRNCVFKDKEGVSVEEFEYVIDYCLLPQICDDSSSYSSESLSFSNSLSQSLSKSLSKSLSLSLSDSLSDSSDSFGDSSIFSDSFSDSQSGSYVIGDPDIVRKAEKNTNAYVNSEDDNDEKHIDKHPVELLPEIDNIDFSFSSSER